MINKSNKDFYICAFKALIAVLVMSCFLISCENSDNVEPEPLNLNGMAVAGSPIDGAVIVKDQLGRLQSCVIEKDGSFSLDVTHFTPPFVLWSDGEVNGKEADYYSTSKEPGYVNVNPVTHAVLAHTISQDPKEYFDSNNPVPEEEKLENVKEKFNPIIRELVERLPDSSSDLGDDFDVMTYKFEANKEGLDRVIENIETKIEDDTIITRHKSEGLNPVETVENPYKGALLVLDTTTQDFTVEITETEEFQEIVEKNYAATHQFSENFLWGTTIASHQVDSNNTNNDWYKWESLKRISDEKSNTEGPNHWEHYTSDFDICQKIGTNTVYMSLEWSKIEPEPGKYSEVAIQHYHKIFDALIERNIKPIVSLQHFTLPLWVHDPTPYTPNESNVKIPGWNDNSADPYIVDRIATFAGEMAKEFGSKVDWWVTINEPMTVYAKGYLTGDFPPGIGYKNELNARSKSFPIGYHPTVNSNLNSVYENKVFGIKSGIQAAKVVLPNMIRAHSRMYDAIKANDTIDADGDSKDSMISITKNHVLFREWGDDQESLNAHKQIDYIWNQMIWDAIILGQLDSDLDQAPDETLSGNFPKVDFISFNYDSQRDVIPAGVEEAYTVLGFNPSELDYFLGFPVDTSVSGQTLNPLLMGNNYDCLQCEIHPEGIKDVIAFYSDKYGQSNLPMLITKMGTDNDLDQPGFIVDMLDNIGEAISNGHNVIGYLHYALIDGFEWEHGFGRTFGLVSIDENKKRTIKDSGGAFSNIILNHGVVPALKEKYGTIESPANIQPDKSLCSANLNLPDDSVVSEKWETALDGTQGSVSWTIVQTGESILASGKGTYIVIGYNVEFPFENTQAFVADSVVTYTATGTASIAALGMTSSFKYVFDGKQGKYKIFVDDETWQSLLDSHPIEGVAVSTLVSGSGITDGGDEVTKWEAALNESEGTLAFEITEKTDDSIKVSGNGTYKVAAYNVLFPFENVSATQTNAGLSFTATGTASIIEMPTMTSAYTFKLNSEDNTYEISVEDTMWQGMLDAHPIVGTASITPIQDAPASSEAQGDSAPLTTKKIDDLEILLKKNGTFAVLNQSGVLLQTLGDPASNGGLIWRNAPVKVDLPLAASTSGGFMGHENLSMESEENIPWTKAIRVIKTESTEDSITLTVAQSEGITRGTLNIQNIEIENNNASIVKVTIKVPEDANHLACSFASDENERFYGFGSPTWTTQHRGNKIPIWVTEQLLGRVTDEDPANTLGLKGHPYDNQIPIPFFMSSNGYGVLLDTTYRSIFEMCTEDHPDSWRLETWNNETSFYIFTGEKFTDLLKTYTALSGRPEMPPDWFFGPMNDAVRGEANVLRVAKLIRDNDIPSTVIWTEDWLGIGSQQTGFRLSHDWDASDVEYPNLESMIDTLHSDGFKFLGYFSPFIPNPATTPGHNQDKWQAANDNKYYFLNPEGTMREMLVPPLIPPAGGGLDLTKSEAVNWYKTYVRQAAQIGLDGAMVDFGEWVPFDSVFADGRTAPEVHNEYPLLWQKANKEVWDSLVSDDTKDDYLFYVRSGYVGSQKYAPAFWAGDQNTDWDRLDGMASVITMGLNLGLSGISYFGHDIGGYSSFDTPQVSDLDPQTAAMLPPNMQSELWDGVSSKELFLRWAAIGAYSPMMRTHHGSRYGQNWSFEGGPNPNNFTITSTTISALNDLFGQESFLANFADVTRTNAISNVQSALGGLQDTSYGTWVDIDAAIRNAVGDTDIDILQNSNLNVAKLILRYAGQSAENLAQPQYDAETINTWKKFAQQHIALFPYLKAYAKESVDFGLPIMRHMILLYPDDKIIQNGIPDDADFQAFSGQQSGKRPYNELFQYFLGNELLIAPIIDPDTISRPVYLPQGTWYNIATREQCDGGQTIIASANIDEIPIFAPVGSIVPRLPEGVETLVAIDNPDITDYNDKQDILRLTVYSGKDGSFKLADGTNIQYIHKGIIDNLTTANVNGEPVDINHQDRAIEIETPKALNISLELSCGASLQVTDAPIARTYQVCIVAPKPIFAFPKDFLWGTATAAHQVESDNTNNDWYAWEELRRVKDDHSNLTGPDHWNNYEKDFDIAKNDLGTNSYRLSIEWSKIEPEPDQYSSAVIQHYHDILDALIERNIEPVVSMQHFSLPLWIHDPAPDPNNNNLPTNPGWNDDSATPYIVERIVKFTEDMAKEFGSKVDWWITINEPLVMYANGYLVGDFPPGIGYKNEPGALNLPFPLGHHDTIKENLLDAYKTKAYGLKTGIQASKVIFPNIIRAHVRMYDAIKANDTVDADGDNESSMISISKHHVVLRPLGTDDLNLAAYNQMNFLWNQMIWDAIILGQLDSDLDTNYDEDLTQSYGSFPKVDYIGFNYYARRDVVPVEQMSMMLGVDVAEFDFFKGFPVDTSATGALSELLLGNNYNCLGWEIYPQGMKDIIAFYSETYGKEYNLPIFITENGTDNDADRPGFVVDMIELMGEAMQEGHNVIGYLHWSLMDNFEWERGYGQHFGLVRVDFDFENKQENRTVTEGGEAFASIVKNKGILQSLKDEYGTFYNPTNIRDDSDICAENQGETPDSGGEIWETTLDSTKGSVSWSITKADDGSVLASGEGLYGMNAMGNDVTVSFPFENVLSIVADSTVLYTATGTASIKEMPSMTSGFIYIFDGVQQKYTIYVDDPTWQSMLDDHPIIGEAVSALVSGSGITSKTESTKWQAELDTSKGEIAWEIIDTDNNLITGEGTYYLAAMGQNFTVSFPFENVSATLTDAGMSFTASGTAVILEMPSMTSSYTCKLDAENNTYEISVDDAAWQSMLTQHPIVGSAEVSPVEDEPGPTVKKGDSSPLTSIQINELNVLFRKNGTFSLYKGAEQVLNSLGDPASNGGVQWRNAEVSVSLPLAGTVQGGFMGHENFTVESEEEAPWQSATKAIDMITTEKGIQLTLSEAQEVTKGMLIVEEQNIEGVSTPVMKVTIKAPNNANHVSCSFASESDERFYGFGSPTWTTQHRGNSIPIWVTEQLLGRVTEEDPDNTIGLKGHPYDNQIPIPFFMSSNGYGILLDTTYRSLFEMCTEGHPDSWRIETWHNETSFYIFTGDTFTDLLKTYTAISGRPDMPPDWFFGPMNDAVRGEANVLRVAKLIRDHDIPSTVIWTEDWLGIGSQQTGFRLSHDWDASDVEYPDLEGMIDNLHDDGFKFMGYFSPFIPNPTTTPGHNVDKWQAANDNTYFFLNPEGTMREMLVPPLVPPPGGGLDLTNSEAVNWYKNYVRQAAQIGLDGAMVDFGEWVPFDAVFADGRTAPEVHNEYPLLWQKANKEVWDSLVSDGTKDDYLFYVRSGYAGSQKYAPAFWAGDQNTNWDRLDGMASVITMGLNLGLSGISYFGHDIGGYSSFDTPQIHELPPEYAGMLPPNMQSELWDGVSSKELFLRWAEIGAYSPMMRTHHGSRYGQNWSFEGGPNPANFTITSDSVATIKVLFAKESFRAIFSQDALTALANVESALDSLQDNSFATWIDIDSAIRNAAGDSDIDTLAASNLNVAKLILQNAQQNNENLSHPKYDAETIETWKKFAQQHISLFPYLKVYAKESADYGLPMMRHMILLYPDDEVIQNGIPDNEDFQQFSGEQSGKRPFNELFQYFLGNELLVAPIIDPGADSRPVYLPQGTWYNIFTRDQYTGGQTIIADANIDEIPVFAPAGSIIPKLVEGIDTLVDTANPDVTDYNDKSDMLRIAVYSGKDGSFSMTDGTQIQYFHNGTIDNLTTANVNGSPVDVSLSNKAISIETPKSTDISLELSCGASLNITNAPIARTYQICIVAPKPIFAFPENFLWGTATAAHQVESDNINNDWYAWEELNRIKDGHSNLTGPAHWEHYTKDFDIARNDLGTNSYRMSIEWSKIEPEPDTYDQDVINHYHKILDALIERNLKPVVSIQHFSLPLWIHNPTPDPDNNNKPINPGWNDDSQIPYIVERIVQFTEDMAAEFGSKVDWWITINEPLVMYANGYLVGDFPPGIGYKNEPSVLNVPFPMGHHDTIKENLLDAYKTEDYGLKAGIMASKVIFPNIIRAHVRMYDAIKAYDTVDADGDNESSMISISKHHVVFRPLGTDEVNLTAYNQMEFLWNQMIWDAIILGQLDSDLDQNYDEDLTQNYGTFPKVDYIGFNYYARRDIVPVDQMSMMLGIPVSEFDFFKGFPVDTSATGALSELLLGNNYNCLGWEIYPQGMKDIIAFYSETYGKEYNLPIFITENGTDNDADRPGFVVDMIELMGEAMQEGHNVIGYLHWSLMDNFEWERGYGQHFGLVRVDFDYANKQENRTVTEGGEAFASIIKNNGIVQSLKDEYGTFYNPTNIRDDQSICAENQGETPGDGKTSENWETALDATKGSVTWSITREDDGSLIASGEGLYGMNAAGNNVTVSFPFANVQAFVADSSVLYTATGTALIQEMPSMTSGFTYIFDGVQNSYKIYVDSTMWQGMLDSHPIVGQAISTLVSGNGITSESEATKWQATLDSDMGEASWEIIDTENTLVSGEGTYFLSVAGQNFTVVFPFENAAGTLTDAGISFIATGTATIKEMPTMTSAYTCKIDAESGTYEISVDSATWQGMLSEHPIVGSADISPIEDDPGPTVQKGDNSPLTTIVIDGLNVLFRKNGTFSLYNGGIQVLNSIGDPTSNGGILWRNAEITAALPLAGAVQGGFLGHEKITVESDEEAPWQSAIKAVDILTTEKGIQLTVAEAQEMTKGMLIVEEKNIEGISTPVMKVTIKAPEHANHVSCSFASDADERFYGFGSPTWTTQHRGNSIPIWVTEQLLGRVTDEDPSNFMELKGHPYDNQIPIPFFMSSNGYGILLDTTYRSIFEMCTDNHPDSWRIETCHNETSFYIFTGESFTDLLKTYTAISGRPDMPPDWFFGPMNDAVRGEANVLRVAKLIRDHDIPSTVIWTEDWLGIGSQQTGFRLSHDWDASDIEYPNLETTIDSLHADGFKFLGYFSPFIPNPTTTPGHNADKWQAANDNTYFFLNPEGTMREMLVPPLIPPAGGGLDLTKSEAVNWYKNYVRQAAQIGLDGAMVDFGEWVPFDSVFADGRTAPEVHNEYPLLWQKANKEVWDSLVSDGTKDDYLFYVRSGYAGSQKYAPAFWAGDQNTNWDRLDGMASVITMGLNLGLSGISYFGHDIGGYSSFDTPQVHELPPEYAGVLPPNMQSELWDGVSSKELFLRWAAIGAYSPMMRTHHGSRYGQNWSFEGGPNPVNFTITSESVATIKGELAKDSFRTFFSQDALTALANVESALDSLQDESFATWIEIDTAIRNAAGDADIDTLAAANLNVAKLILRYSQQNTENLSNPQYDAETIEIWKKFAQQHIALFPYLKTYAKDSVDYGLPIMRHMILLYPDDEVIQNGIPDNAAFQQFSGEQSGKRPFNELFQYFLGNELLVAPIIDPGTNSRPVYLPQGTWYNRSTREQYTGEQTIIANANIDEIPIFAPAGSIIPQLPEGIETLVEIENPDIIDYNDKKDALRLTVYSGEDGSFTLIDGTHIQYTHKGTIDKSITATVNDVLANVTVLDKAIEIETTKSDTVFLELSCGATLQISNAPLARTYQICIAAPIPDDQVDDAREDWETTLDTSKGKVQWSIEKADDATIQASGTGEYYMEAMGMNVTVSFPFDKVPADVLGGSVSFTAIGTALIKEMPTMMSGFTYEFDSNQGTYKITVDDPTWIALLESHPIVGEAASTLVSGSGITDQPKPIQWQAKLDTNQGDLTWEVTDIENTMISGEGSYYMNAMGQNVTVSFPFENVSAIYTNNGMSFTASGTAEIKEMPGMTSGYTFELDADTGTYQISVEETVWQTMLPQHPIVGSADISAIESEPKVTEWQAKLDGTQGEVSWEVTDTENTLISGEGSYHITAMGTQVTVSFSIENVSAIYTNEGMSFTASGTALIKEIPGMESGYTFIMDADTGTYTIIVDNTTWQMMLEQHPIVGSAEISPSENEPNEPKPTDWQAKLDTSKGDVTWEVIDTENTLISGEGSYYMEAMGQSVTVSFPFEQVSATYTNDGMSFTASGNAVIKEIPGMESSYTFILDADTGTYTITVDNATWQSLLESHPIVGLANIDPFEPIEPKATEWQVNLDSGQGDITWEVIDAENTIVSGEGRYYMSALGQDVTVLFPFENVSAIYTNEGMSFNASGTAVIKEMPAMTSVYTCILDADTGTYTISVEETMWQSIIDPHPMVGSADFYPIDIKKNHKAIVDQYGREMMLRGVNARIEGVFDVSFDDGREPLEPIPSFSAADTEAMQRIGFNFLRLPINWSAIEPSPNNYSQEYLNAIQHVLDLCEQAGISVLLDMHQDAYSKEIGEDGAPLWAIIPPPEKPNEGGHLGNLVTLRFSEQVQKAFMSFWNNTEVSTTAKGLQDHFIDAMCHVMENFKDHSAVIGMEIFNEPWLLHTDMDESDISKLHDFYAKAIERLKNISSDKLIFFEPDVSKNFPSADNRPQYTAIIPETIPWDTDQTVYAPHLYINNFILTGNPDPDDPEIITNVMNSLIEASGFKAPLMIGEFGFNHRDEDYAATMDVVMNLADQYLFHTAQWVWKENSQDAWGFYDYDNDTPVLRESIAHDTARAYPQAISGKIERIRFDRETGKLTVHFTYTDTGKPHILFIPVTYAYDDGFSVMCDGVNIDYAQDNFGRLSVSCGADDGYVHVLEVLD